MTDENTADAQEIGAYSVMFEEYCADQKWISSNDLPIVFHIRMLCRQLDAAGATAAAALSSAYLKAFQQLDRRRPGAVQVPGDLPGQASIFDELD